MVTLVSGGGFTPSTPITAMESDAIHWKGVGESVIGVCACLKLVASVD